jgi:hypothetical protein
VVQVVFFCLESPQQEVDPDKRPDIFQVSYLAFKITGRENTLPNMNVCMSIIYNVVLVHRQ